MVRSKPRKEIVDAPQPVGAMKLIEEHVLIGMPNGIN